MRVQILLNTSFHSVQCCIIPRCLYSSRLALLFVPTPPQAKGIRNHRAYQDLLGIFLLGFIQLNVSAIIRELITYFPLILGKHGLGSDTVLV